MTDRALLERLREAGGTGLDMSPGDSLCLEAAVRIESLQAVLDELIACKDLEITIDASTCNTDLLRKEYNRRNPAAWLAARRTQREG